jgi:hypothetical protein
VAIIWRNLFGLQSAKKRKIFPSYLEVPDVEAIPVAPIHKSILRRAVRDERAQVLPWTAFMILSMLGMGGLVMDVGRAYVVRAQIQNSANAAALAAAGEVFNSSSTSNATTVGTQYSASSGDNNANSTAVTVTTTVNTVCLNILMPRGETCASNSPEIPNAVRVTQTAIVKTYFMPLLFGPRSLSVSTAATASMQGSALPYNIAIILDATASMSDAPNATVCPGYSSNFSCALGAIRTFLGRINPCAGVSGTCSASNAKVRISLFSFPNVSTSNVADDYTCGGSPTNEPYTLPAQGISSYSNLTYGSTTATYQDVPYSVDWYANGASDNLNTNSNLVQALSGCMQNPGGERTYYASVIYAAQASLLAEQNSISGLQTQNAIIMLSDGQANAPNTSFPSSGSSVTPTSAGYSVTTNSSGNTTTNLAGGTWGTYPDFHDQCQQAIQAAQDAQAAGTTIWSVAYGSEANGCAVSGSGAVVADTTFWASATSGNPALSLASLTPCVTMKNIASPTVTTGPLAGTSFFYADGTSASNGCTDNAHSIGGSAFTTLGDIFNAIANSFTTPRLLPNNAT